MKKLLLYSLLALVGGSTAWAQAPIAKATARPGSKATGLPSPTAPAATYAATIRQADLREHLTVLASDDFQGRETGQAGQKKAAAYLARQLAALGLQGPVKGSADGYLQAFEVRRGLSQEGGYLEVGGQRYTWLRDFFSYGPILSPFPTETAGQPVFAGFGIDQANYSDYAGLDVRGKDVLVLMGEPQDAKGRNLLTGTKQEGDWASGTKKIALAKQKGARSIFFLTFGSTAEFQAQAAQLAPALREPAFLLPDPGQPAPDADQEETPTGIGVYLVSPELGQRLAGTTEENLLGYVAAIGKKKGPVPLNFQPPGFTVHLPQQQQTLTTENVLGLVEGTDRKDEVLVISAHYDHLGMKHDTIYNGADDDGSGTAAVLEIAQAFAQAKKEGHGPRRSVLFVLMTGEEEGLFGSEYYTGHPVLPLANTVANLNIDMVGRTDKAHADKPDFVYVVGDDRLSWELHTVSEAANAQHAHLALDYAYNAADDPEQLYYRSDHYNFARRGIPVIFYTSGLHADYHKATDDVDKIEFGPLEKRTRLVFHTAWELANRDQRVALDAAKN
ncbi:Peptidase family M28 [Hymenobacter daecheongensis DSM 21074]|uniref:Peptidase family M28 n=1 Tax=Hymenobacter daecheongensis DSM 21074 TaxID=1121955 RepID=A0A1M6A882_9BACT|nr:M28 family peptidase [Hymenobacter daecheongensis]SHI32682.1 Peptidase family M28 [Hymenobacter daecheongensis DSM 21074]